MAEGSALAEEDVPATAISKRGRPKLTAVITEKREDMNVYKQISKLNPYLKTVENLSSKDKYNHLKSILDINMMLRPNDIKEIIAVNSMRLREVTIAELRVLEGSRHKLVLIRNSCGLAYLFNYRTQRMIFLNELVFGKDSKPENIEKFMMKEVHLMMLPEFGKQETFTALNLFEDVLGKINLLLASSKQKVYLMKYDPEADVVTVIRDCKAPLIKAIEKGPDRFTWICVVGNTLTTLSIATDDSLDITTESRFDDIDRIEKIKTLNNEMYFWQFGSLYWLKDGEPHLLHRSDRAILDVFFVQGSLLVVHVDASVTNLQQDPDNNWLPRLTTKLALVSIQGAAVSLNECLLLTLGQRSLFDETAELSVYNIKDLCAAADTTSTKEESDHSEVVDLVTWCLKTFSKQTGNYSDILSLLLSLNKLETIRTIIEHALDKDDKSKNASENAAGFLTELQTRLQLESPLETKLLMSRFFLNLQPTSDVKQLKSNIVITTLKISKAETSLLKSLKEGAAFECPVCRTKTLSVDLASLAGECGNCGTRVGLTLAQASVQHVPELNVTCLSCGLFHHPKASRCLLCGLHLERLSDIC